MAGFTAVATGIGLATTAATTIGSFAQAMEQSELKKEAELAAAKAIEDARKMLEVNFYEGLGIQKEPYELARRNLLAQGALSTEALKEGDERSLAAGVGRVQLAQQAGQEKVTTAMQQELTDIEKLVLDEESRLRDARFKLKEKEALDAQRAAADAGRTEAMALQQGFEGLTSLGADIAALPSLYSKTPEVRAQDRLSRQAARKDVDLSTLDLTDSKALKEAGLTLTNRQIGAIKSQGIKTFDELREFNRKGVTKGAGMDGAGMDSAGSVDMGSADMGGSDMGSADMGSADMGSADRLPEQLENLLTLPLSVIKEMISKGEISADMLRALGLGGLKR